MDPSLLCGNEYNPNTVLTNELKLLKHNLMSIGWVQPILARNDKKEGKHYIIDGYHRWWLTSNDREIAALADGKLPVVLMDLDETEYMALTVRINRAKGVHEASKLHEIVFHLYDKGLSKKQIAEEIGGSIEEISSLLRQGVFDAKGIKRHKYSRAWVPDKTDSSELDPYIK